MPFNATNMPMQAWPAPENFKIQARLHLQHVFDATTDPLQWFPFLAKQRCRMQQYEHAQSCPGTHFWGIGDAGSGTPGGKTDVKRFGAMTRKRCDSKKLDAL